MKSPGWLPFLFLFTMAQVLGTHQKEGSLLLTGELEAHRNSLRKKIMSIIFDKKIKPPSFSKKISEHEITKVRQNLTMPYCQNLDEEIFNLMVTRYPSKDTSELEKFYSFFGSFTSNHHLVYFEQALFKMQYQEGLSGGSLEGREKFFEWMKSFFTLCQRKEIRSVLSCSTIAWWFLTGNYAHLSDDLNALKKIDERRTRNLVLYCLGVLLDPPSPRKWEIGGQPALKERSAHLISWVLKNEKNTKGLIERLGEGYEDCPALGRGRQAFSAYEDILRKAGAHEEQIRQIGVEALKRVLKRDLSSNSENFVRYLIGGKRGSDMLGEALKGIILHKDMRESFFTEEAFIKKLLFMIGVLKEDPLIFFKKIEKEIYQEQGMMSFKGGNLPIRWSALKNQLENKISQWQVDHFLSKAFLSNNLGQSKKELLQKGGLPSHDGTSFLKDLSKCLPDQFHHFVLSYFLVPAFQQRFKEKNKDVERLKNDMRNQLRNIRDVFSEKNVSFLLDNLCGKGFDLQKIKNFLNDLHKACPEALGWMIRNLFLCLMEEKVAESQLISHKNRDDFINLICLDEKFFLGYHAYLAENVPPCVQDLDHFLKIGKVSQKGKMLFEKMIHQKPSFFQSFLCRCLLTGSEEVVHLMKHFFSKEEMVDTVRAAILTDDFLVHHVHFLHNLKEYDDCLKHSYPSRPLLVEALKTISWSAENIKKVSKLLREALFFPDFWSHASADSFNDLGENKTMPGSIMALALSISVLYRKQTESLLRQLENGFEEDQRKKILCEVLSWVSLGLGGVGENRENCLKHLVYFLGKMKNFFQHDPKAFYEALATPLLEEKGFFAYEEGGVKKYKTLLKTAFDMSDDIWEEIEAYTFLGLQGARGNFSFQQLAWEGLDDLMTRSNTTEAVKSLIEEEVSLRKIPLPESSKAYLNTWTDERRRQKNPGYFRSFIVPKANVFQVDLDRGLRFLKNNKNLIQGANANIVMDLERCFQFGRGGNEMREGGELKENGLLKGDDLQKNELKEDGLPKGDDLQKNELKEDGLLKGDQNEKSLGQKLDIFLRDLAIPSQFFWSFGKHQDFLFKREGSSFGIGAKEWMWVPRNRLCTLKRDLHGDVMVNPILDELQSKVPQEKGLLLGKKE